MTWMKPPTKRVQHSCVASPHPSSHSPYFGHAHPSPQTKAAARTGRACYRSPTRNGSPQQLHQKLLWLLLPRRHLHFLLCADLRPCLRFLALVRLCRLLTDTIRYLQDARIRRKQVHTEAVQEAVVRSRCPCLCTGASTGANCTSSIARSMTNDAPCPIRGKVSQRHLFVDSDYRCPSRVARD